LVVKFMCGVAHRAKIGHILLHLIGVERREFFGKA
jgi:hypothetical protein